MIDKIQAQVNATLWLIGQGDRTEAQIEALYSRLGKTCVALVTQSLPMKKKYPKDPVKAREYNTSYQRERRKARVLEHKN